MSGQAEKAFGPHHKKVIIIGAGFGGIAMACQLKRKLGCTDYCVLERQSGIGGTWWINTYPGIACDIPSPFYSLSFAQKPDWSTFFAPGKEISQYLDKVVDDFKLRDSLRLDTEVVSCKWNTTARVWEVTSRQLRPGLGDLSAAERKRMQEIGGPSSVYLGGETKWTCTVLVSAVGGLVEPAPWPVNVPGKDKFQGDIIHSARWDAGVDFRGKNVVVVGTGCSAAQLVPRLLSSEYGAGRVTQLMREPPWVLPRVTPPLGDKFYETWSPWLCSYVPSYMRAFRALVALVTELDFGLFGASRSSEKKRAKLQKSLIQHLKQTAPSKYHDMLTPQYSIGCKRRIYDTAWFPCLHDSRIELTTLSMESVDEDSVTLRPGPKTHASEKNAEARTVPADIIVLANGFAVNRWFHPLEVVGSKGTTLQQEFDERGGAQLYLGTAMDGFPNMFFLFGPNSFTGHSSVVLGLENQVDHAIKLMRPVIADEAELVEVKKSAVVKYNVDVQSDLKKMVWNGGGCSNWYVGSEGRNSMSYPYSMAYQTMRYMFPTWSDWNVSWARKQKRSRAWPIFFCACLIVALSVATLRANGTLETFSTYQKWLSGYVSNLVLHLK